MKVTRDKTSVDLGNGLRIEMMQGVYPYLYFTTESGTESGIRLGGTGHDWAEEQLAKHFTPVHITLETEDEACTLWHYLNTSRGLIIEWESKFHAKPKEWKDEDMFLRLESVYKPKDTE